MAIHYIIFIVNVNINTELLSEYAIWRKYECVVFYSETCAVRSQACKWERSAKEISNDSNSNMKSQSLHMHSGHYCIVRNRSLRKKNNPGFEIWGGSFMLLGCLASGVVQRKIYHIGVLKQSFISAKLTYRKILIVSGLRLCLYQLCISRKWYFTVEISQA